MDFGLLSPMSSEDKRLSTAEALCQYWHARAMGHHAREQDRLYRFATRPHYDEENEEQ